jgi:hypothetical protein
VPHGTAGGSRTAAPADTTTFGGRK